MRKVIILIVCVLFLGSAYASDIDLSNMSYDELVALKDRINLAMWNSQEWQEVSVPVGIWEIGKDIPVNHWLISPVEGDWGQVFYCEKVDFDIKKPDHDGKSHTIVIADKLSSFGNQTVNEIDYDMKAGWFFINEVPVVFTPYTGKPELGFK